MLERLKAIAIPNRLTLFSGLALLGKILLCGTVLVLAYQLVDMMYSQRLNEDFHHKSYHPRFWQSEAMASFIRKEYGSDAVFWFGGSYDVSMLLSLDGWWDKEICLPCMVPDGADVSFFDRFVFIGKNYKIYDRKRHGGFGVFLPSKGDIKLNVNGLLPGEYRISLSDTELAQEILSNISVKIMEKGVFTNVSKAWEKESFIVKLPTENVYPPLMLPRYSSYEKRVAPWGVCRRKANRYSIDFSLSEEADGIYLRNQGKALSLMGSIDIFSRPENRLIFTLDLDWGETKKIKTMAGMVYEGEVYPLLWKNLLYSELDNRISRDISPLVFELEGNFGDVKVFRLFKGTLDLSSS